MSQKDYKIIIKKLQKIGLKEKEASVYVALLSYANPVGTSKLVKSTGLYGQYVYDALATLEERGLALHAQVGKRKRFFAQHPSRLELLAEQQKLAASEISRELTSLVQKNHSQDFALFQGEDSFIAHELSELQNAKYKEEWLIIGGSGDRFIEIMRDTFKEFDLFRNKKEISIRYIGSESQKEDLRTISSERPRFTAKTLKGFGTSIVNTLIRPNSISLGTHGDPVLTYQVENIAVADSYRNFFEALWDTCEKV